MLTIRRETPDDIDSIRRVNCMAFGRREEANLIDALRANHREAISLVAELDGKVVGHACFSRVDVTSEAGLAIGMALAPLAVLPRHQRQGVGTALVRAGLQSVKDAGYDFVLVLGHPQYYPRFGFEPAGRYGVVCPWPNVPPEAFMIALFDPTCANELRGRATYQPEFDTMA